MPGRIASRTHQLPSPETERLPSFLTHNLSRLQTVSKLVGNIGLINTGRFVHSRLTDTSTENKFSVTDKRVRHPLMLSGTPSDIYNYLEVIDREVYRLPKETKPRVNGKQIIDAGAYIGLSAAYFASQYPDSPVLAIEPHSRNHRLLTENALPYGGQVEAVRAALSLGSEPVGARQQDSSSNYMAYLFAGEQSDDDIPQAEKCLALTPESLLGALPDAAEIGILKVDIEGAERDIFGSGAFDEVLSRTEFLLIETHDRFVSGSSQAVATAAARNDLVAMDVNPHTDIYCRQ